MSVLKRRSSLRLVQIWLFHLLGGPYFNSAQVLYYLYLDQGVNYFEFATMFMRIYLMLVCVDGVQMLSSSFFSSIKKAYLGMFLSMTRQVLFLIPLVLILPKFFGLNGILYAAPIADFVAFVVSVICISTEFKKLNELEKSRKTNSL